MKWAILSDVHGNLEAFQAVIQDLRRQGAEQVAFLGDVVGYGANPNECLALLRELAEWVVAGNHDCGAVGLTDIDTFNSAAHTALLWSQKQLSMENIAYLRGLPLWHQREEVTFVHASPNEPAEWNYMITFPEAEEGFQALAGDLAFVGHTHQPLALAKEARREVQVISPEEVILKEGIRYIINVGSVGQPRDSNPQAAYGLYDDVAKRYILKRVTYDIQAAQKKIIKAGLPSFLAQRLSKGN
jgi:diadenosine tetraphosphatase ApaH/serine/threonine PP2A family protein phosphatase